MIVRAAAALAAAAAAALFPHLSACAQEPDVITVSSSALGERVSPSSFDRRLATIQSALDAQDVCGPPLETAQTQRDIVAASPAFEIVVGDAAARLANIDYRLYLARASCGPEGAPREGNLRAALDAAQRASGLYRDVHDYQSVAVMQYDAAAAYRLLGERGNAVAALDAALVTDRDYGLAADAADNAKLLARWKGQAGAPQPSIPRRAVSLKFGWAARDADVSIRADYRDMVGEEVVRSGASTSLMRHIRFESGGWTVSSEAGDRQYDLAGWRGTPKPELAENALVRAALRLWAPALIIDGKGILTRVADADGAAAEVAGDAETAGRGLFPSEELHAAVRRFTDPDRLESLAAEDYALFVSAWIGADLEQGEWTEMTAPLLLPGMPQVVDHDVQFVYARPLACGAAVCAEILLHAVPAPDALETALGDLKRSLKLTGTRTVHYFGATDLRLVIEPGTLLPHIAETRGRWYVAIDGKEDPLAGSETVVSTWSYR